MAAPAELAPLLLSPPSQCLVAELTTPTAASSSAPGCSWIAPPWCPPSEDRHTPATNAPATSTAPAAVGAYSTAAAPHPHPPLPTPHSPVPPHPPKPHGQQRCAHLTHQQRPWLCRTSAPLPPWPHPGPWPPGPRLAPLLLPVATSCESCRHQPPPLSLTLSWATITCHMQPMCPAIPWRLATCFTAAYD